MTPPRSRITIEKLRRFSETSVPRRFVNYFRSQISILDWQIIAKDASKPFNQTQKKRVRQVTNLLAMPSPDMNWNTFIEQVVEEMCVPGVAGVEVKTLRPRERNDINDDTTDAANHALYVFDGSSLSYYTDWDGSPSAPRYAQLLPDGKIVNFRNSEIIPFKFTPRANTPHGLSPMDVACQDIEQFLEAGVFAGRTASSANPKKALWIQNLTSEQRSELQTYWDSDVSGSGKMPVIGGEKAESIELGLVTDQNLFLAWQQFKIAVIAAAFGVDAMKANIISGVNRSTGDAVSETTDEGAIKPLADNIAQYINQYVLPLYGLADVAEFRFVYTALSDRKAISTVHQIELQDDTLTVNEARIERGQPPLLHPLTGEDIGNVTLAFYREIVKIPEFRVKGLAGLEEAIQRQTTLDQAKTSPPGGNGENTNNTNPDESQRGGNGASGAPNPKDKPLNRADERDNTP